MSKYQNNEIFKVIGIYNVQVGDFVRALNNAICLTDDIIDHKIHTNYVLDIMAEMFEAMYLAPKDLVEKIRPAVMDCLKSETENLTFIPCQSDKETELAKLYNRANLMNIYFECLCYVDETFDTEDNRKWLEEFKLAALVCNDCKDILEETWEDLIQCRRNYVILKYFDQDMYFKWRENKDKIKTTAQEVMSNFKLINPPDKRLAMIGGNNA